MIENANLRADVHRLRIENKELLKRVRFADTNAYYMRVSHMHTHTHTHTQVDQR